MKAALSAALFAFTVAGCGEMPQALNYKNGHYAGKPDTPAWQRSQFNNDRAEWERVIKTRTLKQSEYTRMKGSG